MSGLEAFSMACNVMTVISFSLETIDLYRRIYESGSSDPKLATSAERVRKISVQVEQLLNNQPQLGSAQRVMTTDAEVQLRDIAAECLQYSKDIEKQITSISPKKSGLPRALKSTVKTVWRKPRLDQLKSHLEASKKDMDTAINVQILEECIRSGKLNCAIYTTLTEDSKSFIKTYSERSQVIEVLLGKISLQMTDQKRQISKLQKEFHARFDIMETSHHDQKAYNGLLQSLKYEDMDERKSQIPIKHKETFEWIFEGQGSFGNGSAVEEMTSETSDEQRWRGWRAEQAKEKQREADFLGWLEGDSPGPFWVSGKPGSGKSTLMKFIMRDDRTKTALQNWRPQPKIITHFFWKLGTPHQHDLLGLLCSLLHQVLFSDTGAANRLLYNRPKLGHKRGVTDWDTDELQECLFETLRCTSRYYLVLLDGLDEHSNPHGGMDELFTFLDSLMQNDRVKLCISSRPERIFEDGFSSGRRLRMQDLVFSDILNYTVESLKGIGLKSTDSMKEAIIDEIVGKAEGVFMWVHLVLQSVKNGLQQFNETWEQIYKRILDLPRNLMQLYKEMWSRLGNDSDRYIRQAALYFDLVRSGRYCTVALLAVASDALAESFTGPDDLDLPSVSTVVQMCKYTHQTVHSISGGLLEVQTPFSSMFSSSDGPNSSENFGDSDDRTKPDSLEINNLEDMYAAMGKWDSYGAYVNFTHKTAIDFLDSDEGKALFAEHSSNEEDVISRWIKGAIILGSIPYTDGFGGIVRILHHSRYEAPDLSSRPLFDLLSLSRRLAHQIKDFSSPPPNFSSDIFFIYLAAFFGLFDYITDTLDGSQDDVCDVAHAALMGAAGRGVYVRSPQESSSRYRFIQTCLQHCAQAQQERPNPPTLNPYESILTAWRCFLMEEIMECKHVGNRSSEGPDSDVEQVMEAFIKAGVLRENHSLRYLIDAHAGQIFLPNTRTTRNDAHHITWIGEYTSLLLEVNDNFLVRQLSNLVTFESEVILQAATEAAMRPLLVRTGDVREPFDMFYCHLGNDKDVEEFWEWIDEGFCRERWPNFTDGAPSCLSLTYIGIFDDVFDVLEEIDFPLPDVNEQHGCYHSLMAFYA